MINLVSVRNFTPISNLKFNSNPISFKSLEANNDVFEKSQIKQVKFNQNVPQETKKTIINNVNDICQQKNNTAPLGYGATGIVYYIPDTEGFEDGVVLKFPYEQDINPTTGQKQKVGYSYDKEIEILKEVADFENRCQQYIGEVKLENGKSVLVTSFVKGKQPDAEKNPLNKESLANALEVFYNLDSHGILHRDLKQENILIDEDNNFKLIDFGEAIKFDFTNVKENDSQNNFIYFEAPTNLQNFEDTFVSAYYSDLVKMSKSGADEFYKDYLTMKGSIIHERKAQDLNQYLKSTLGKLSLEEFNNIQAMADYQDNLAKVFKKPSESVVNIELMKNQVTYLSELAYKNEILLANPLANVSMKADALISAKKLEAMVRQELKKPNLPEVRTYLENQLEIAKYRQKKIAGWLNGLVGWFCNCMTTDMTTNDENKKKFINECITNNNLEEFEIPTIAKPLDLKG